MFTLYVVCFSGHYCFFLCFAHSAESCDEGSIRLRGSTSSFAGRVEYCTDFTWTTICDEIWPYRAASIACGQLGFSPYGRCKEFS